MRFRWTLGRSLLLISLLGLSGFGMFFFCLMTLGGWNTVYSSGYSEKRFNSIAYGMTREEVEKIIAPPLRKTVREYQHGDEMWEFSDQPTVTSDYWRRSIIFKNGKVNYIVKDYWID